MSISTSHTAAPPCVPVVSAARDGLSLRLFVSPAAADPPLFNAILIPQVAKTLFNKTK